MTEMDSWQYAWCYEEGWGGHKLMSQEVCSCPLRRAFCQANFMLLSAHTFNCSYYSDVMRTHLSTTHTQLPFIGAMKHFLSLQYTISVSVQLFYLSKRTHSSCLLQTQCPTQCHSPVTYHPAGLSHDPHGIEWKRQPPNSEVVQCGLC